MAQFIDMKQVPSGTVTAVDDRIMYDVNLESGIIHGCEISYQGHNMIHINAGYGVIKGGLFEMKDHTEYVDLANSTDTTGQIYLHFDAAAADKLTIISETSSTLHQMVQEEDANFNNGVYEIQLCTYIATQTVLTNVEQTFPAAKGAVDVLDTLQAIMANNEEGKIAGALAVKALNTNLTQISVYVGSDKKLHFVDWSGADSVLNFSSGFKAVICTKPEAFYMDLTDDVPKGYAFRAAESRGTTKTYGIFSFTWASNGANCAIKCSKRIKGYLCNAGIVNGTWSWSEVDWEAKSSHAYYGYILVVTDIID